MSVHESIHVAVRGFPGRVAVECSDAELTYAELWHEAGVFAAALAALEVGPGEPVGIALRRGLPLLPALLGVWRAGGCYVPLDAAAPCIRNERILAETARHGLRWVLVDDDDTVAEMNLTVTRKVVLAGARSSVQACLITEPDGVGRPARDLAYIMYTSGSTGQPKGTMVTHDNVVAFLAATEQAIGAVDDEVTLATTALTFDISVLELFWPLTAGRRVNLLDTFAALDTGRLAALLGTGQPTLLQVTPSTAELVTLPSRPNRIRVLVGGEALPAATAARLIRRCDQLYNMYGPTEATVWFTAHQVRPGDELTDPVSIGRPLPGCEVRVLDDHGDLVADGEVGELCLLGPQVAAGYLDAGETSNARFGVDAVTGQLSYLTGDLVCRRADGTLDFRGRIDSQVKIAGNRVELGEIEAAIREHPAVKGAAVTVGGAASAPTLWAFVQVTRPDAGSDAEPHTGTLLMDWLRLFENEFTEMPEPDEDAEPDFGLWRSFFDGAPISKAEMTEWLEASADLLRGVGARRVLDIGCGTGDMFYAIGDELDRYVGVEPTPAAIPRLRRMFASRSDKASFVRGFAHELRSAHVEAAIVRGFTVDGALRSPDCAVINSVIQYFPSLGYLTDVLTQGLGLLSPRGSLVVADVRSLPLLPLLMARAGVRHDRMSAGRRLATSTELCVDPRFFAVWAAQQEEPVAVWVQPKLLTAHNEIADFRYDVTLTRGTPFTGSYRITDYVAAGGTVDAVASWAADAARRGATAALRGIPNARLTPETGRSGTPIAPVDLRNAVAAWPGTAVALDPSDLDGGALLIAYHPDGRHDWAALARDCPEPDLFATRPWMAVAEEMMGSEIWSFLAARLPAHMIPARVRVVDQLPLTTSGKVDRAGLSQGPPTGTDVTGAAHALAAPNTGMRDSPLELVIELLGGLLDVPVEPDDDFLRLGGSSLDAARLAGLLWSRWGWSITPGQVLRARTPRAVAGLSPDGGRAGRPELPDVRAQRRSTPELSIGQRAILAQTYLDIAGNERMTVVLRWLFEGDPDPRRVRAAIDRVVERHPILRTTISPTGATTVLPGTEPCDLTAVPLERAPADWPDLLVRPFELAAEPPARWILRRTGPEAIEVYGVVHHISVDDSAIRTLHDHFVTAYTTGAVGAGDAAAFRPAAALLAERRLQMERAAGDRAFWSARRGTFDDCQGLPRPPAGRSGNRRTSRHVESGASLLEARARAVSVTPYTVFIAAIGQAMSSVLHGRPVLAGVPMSSREMAGGHGELGCFAGMVPLGLRPGDDAVAYQRQVADELILALDHGLLPLAEITRLAALPTRGWNEVPFGFVCELEPMPEPVTAGGSRITLTIQTPERQLYPVNLRGEIVGKDLVLHLDVEGGLLDDRSAANVLNRVVSVIEHDAWQ
ncbi:amino acid adenylation domain-containing protein [Actinoplanes sp. NBRC 101535]|uniref:amino acid adenylation domain-containing protein n=1 Tax=Actinoplanes sp. NBRC 101535 TaxID=3032196 RepID=UPI0024A04AE6|nr:amino acid adenylation domain-containing protein [Actinoplanes sp. NBRC 101535]GLY02736.1 hypothetical protein Acsp01_31150 [Actinoplanes sp. NBRC 101535]